MADTRIDYLLVGGGRTASNAAKAIRAKDATGSIAIVTSEDRKPYDRPPLSKNFLTGRPPNPEDVEAQGDDFFEESNVQLIRGVAVESIDRELKLATLADGRRFEYGKLLLATGASPNRLDLPGSDQDNVFYLRAVDDSIRIRDAAKSAKRAVMIGAGFIGSEVSATLSGLGLQCSLVGRERHLWDKILSPDTGKWLASYFESKGVSLHMDSQAAEILRHGVRLANGEVLAADIVVVGIGVSLNLGLARDAGLDVDPKRGVLTDKTLRTSDPNIWAAGDIAAYQDVNFGKRWHLEHYMNADWQGTHVGNSMTGSTEPFDKVPYFFSDLFDLAFILRGDAEDASSAKVIGDRQSAEFTELYAYDDDRIAMGLAFTRDADKQDRIGDKIEKYILEKRKVRDINDADFDV